MLGDLAYALVLHVEVQSVQMLGNWSRCILLLAQVSKHVVSKGSDEGSLVKLGLWVSTSHGGLLELCDLFATEVPVPVGWVEHPQEEEIDELVMLLGAADPMFSNVFWTRRNAHQRACERSKERRLSREGDQQRGELLLVRDRPHEEISTAGNLTLGTCPHEEEKRWLRLVAMVAFAEKEESFLGSRGTMEYEHLVENELFAAAVCEFFTDVMWTRCLDLPHTCVPWVDDYSDDFSERKLCGSYWTRKPEVSHSNSVCMTMDSADLPPCFLFRRTSSLKSWMDKCRVPAAPVKAIERQRPVDRQWQWIVGVQKPPDRGRESPVRVDRMWPGERLAGCLAWIVCRWPLRGRKFAVRLSLPWCLFVAGTKKIFAWRRGFWTWPFDVSRNSCLLWESRLLRFQFDWLFPVFCRTGASAYNQPCVLPWVRVTEECCRTQSVRSAECRR